MTEGTKPRGVSGEWRDPPLLSLPSLSPQALMRGPRVPGAPDEDLQRVFLTSDLHLNHENVILAGYCPERGSLFGTVDGMNEALIGRWNARVRDGDVVIVVGDFTMGRPEAAEELIGRLRGTIWLVEGNHDRRPKSRRRILERVVAFYARGQVVVEVPGLGPVLIGHHPVPAGMDGRGLPHGAVLQLCGHVHQHWARRGMVINVGVDVRGFEPRTLPEILAEENIAVAVRDPVSSPT